MQLWKTHPTSSDSSLEKNTLREGWLDDFFCCYVLPKACLCLSGALSAVGNRHSWLFLPLIWLLGLSGKVSGADLAPQQEQLLLLSIRIELEDLSL